LRRPLLDGHASVPDLGTPGVDHDPAKMNTK
jgi:hypothetical protein